MTASRKLALSDMPGWPARLSRDEAAAYLRVSVRHFDVHNRPFIPETREGGRVLYLTSHLDEFAEKVAQPSNKLAALNGL